MSSPKTGIVVIAVLIVLVMVIYDTYNNKGARIVTLYKSLRNKNSRSEQHQTQRVHDNFTEERVAEIKRIIDNLRATYGTPTTHALENITFKSNHTRKIKKVVLAYTTYFGEKPWTWMKDSHAFNHWEGVKCPYYSCELTFNRRDRERSDALIFHAPNMPFITTMRYLLDRKNPRQRWIYFAMESPMNNHKVTKFDIMFNWTLTYRRKSDIFRPYAYYFKSSKIPTTHARDYLKGKDRLVFWTSSHCGLKREDYVRKLMTYIKVDAYGACAAAVGGNAGKCPQHSSECEATLRRYKFQLAFENTYCTDYVTEKYWDGIKKGIVPVVLGGAKYDERIVIPGSFINVMDFTSVKKLADYLVFLDGNDTAYLEYFSWKATHRVTDYPPWNCVLCARLHLDMKPKVYVTLDEMFSAQEHCGKHDKVLRKMLSTTKSNKTSNFNRTMS